MGKTAIPSVFPAEGTYELSTLHVNLSCAAPHAVIRYTTDGTERHRTVRSITEKQV